MTACARSAALRLALAGALAGVLGAAPGPARAQEPGAGTDTVRFRFDWPDGTEATVGYTRVIEREEGTPASRIEIEGEYTMHVHGHPSGLVVEHLDPLATRFRSAPALPPDDPRRIVYSTLGMLDAHWVVSGDGELLGLAAVEALAGSVVDALRPLGLDEASLEAVVAEVTSETQLMGNARDLWRAMVGAWADLDVAVGETFTTQGEEANPIVPSVVLPYLHEYRLVGMEPCAAPGGRCAHLELVSFPDPHELTRVMSDALQQMGLPQMSFERLVQLSQVTLLTDPATLLPHEVVVSKRVNGFLLDGGERKIFRRGDSTRLSFTY